MPWWAVHTYLGLILALCIRSLQLTQVTVYWNSSNPMFNIDNNDHIIRVRMDDEVNIICPYYDSSTNVPNGQREYYAIYQVSKSQYDTCDLKESNTKILIVNCSSQIPPIRGTILLQYFTAIPTQQSYEPGLTYYFITTSSGTLDGVNQQHQGACTTKNMKIQVKVCCDSSTQSPECINSASHYQCPVTTSTEHTIVRTNPPHQTNPTNPPVRRTNPPARTTASTRRATSKGHQRTTGITTSVKETESSTLIKPANSARTFSSISITVLSSLVTLTHLLIMPT